MFGLTACVFAAGASVAADASDVEPAVKADDVWSRATATGDWGGVRSRLETAGIKLGMQEQSEVWGNTTGGIRTGAHYNGLTIPFISFDFEKIAGWKGLTFYAEAYQIHGRGPSFTFVGNQQLLSNIEATPSTKLYRLFFEQDLFDKRFDLRVGQEGANDEMMLIPSAALFLNSSFGFPDHLAQNLPSGGPNYPMATPMVRLRVKPIDEVTLVGAVFNGDPAGLGPGDPQLRDASGTAFRLKDGALAFGEIWVQTGQDDKSRLLPATFKFGGWYHSKAFDDLSRDAQGRSLADPLGSGVARRHRGDYAFYGIADQMIWHPEGTKEQGLTIFGLVMAGPDDRNRENLFVEGGFSWKGAFEGRPNDVLGLGFAYARTSNSLRRFGVETMAATGRGEAFRSHETIIEATYLYQIAPWWTVQPDAQYVINPGASLSGPDGTSEPHLPNTFTVGARTRIDF